MKTEPNDGGPAFPVSDTVHPSGQIQYGFNGMTLRDWFAGMALMGLCANPSRDGSFDGDAETSYMQADAMIALRNKSTKLT